MIFRAAYAHLHTKTQGHMPFEKSSEKNTLHLIYTFARG